MRILNVEVVHPTTKDKQLFNFSTAADGKSLLVTRASRLNKYIEFCFGANINCAEDVVIYLDIDGSTFILSRIHGEQSLKTTLKRVVDNKKLLVAKDDKAYSYLEKAIESTLADCLKNDVVSNKQYQAFDGDLTVFPDIATLLDVKQKIMESNQALQRRSDNVRASVATLASESNIRVSRTELEDISQQLEQTTRDINEINSQLTVYKAQEATSVIAGSIMSELARAQSDHDKLLEQSDYIEEQRKLLQRNDDIAVLIPKIAHLDQLKQAQKDVEAEREDLVKELEWQENELSSINLQLEQKQKQATLITDRQSKIDVINQELSTIADLYALNKTHNEQLVSLNEQDNRLQAEKVLLKNKLVSIENKIADIKKSVAAFHVPDNSIGELIESTRIDVKIDEVTAQLDKLTSELSIKESQIAERESNLVVQVKRFKQVAQLDVAVAPMKAKDTILQVLDAKYNKILTINNALQEKRRNLERALEDYRYRILQVEHSKSVLEKQLEETMIRKQEEFKREVYLSSQKVFTDDASAVFAVTCNMNDIEIVTLKQDIVKREIDKDTLVEKASIVVGMIEEIARQIDINLAEMATLSGEKANINNRYNDIVTNNRSESVFNYLKALDGGNGTKYLLDIQHDAVAGEAELAELKKGADTIRNRIAGLQSRLRYLLETQQQLGQGNSLESLVATNDSLKDQLSDIGERLSTSYEQYRLISQQLEETEAKLSLIKASIIEVSKTVAVNEQQIELSTGKAKKYAGSDDLEQALLNFKYEITDVESELQMLQDSKRTVEKEVFKKRLQLEKLQYVYDSKASEYDKLREEVEFELNYKGFDINSINAYTFRADTERLRDTIAHYDLTKATLAERIENYYNLLANQESVHNIDKAVVSQIAMLEGQLATLLQLQTALEQQHKEKLNLYMASRDNKVRYAVAATEVGTLNQLNQSIAHNEIVMLLVDDKVSDLLRVATMYLRRFVGSQYSLALNNTTLTILDDGITASYTDLEPTQKFAVYLSILLALPYSDHSEGRWLIFDDKLPIDKKVMSDMMSNINGISYLTEHKTIKAG